MINDVTSGALRKRKSVRDGSGKGFDLYDSDDDSQAILRRIRQRMGLGNSQNKNEEEVGTLAALGIVD